MSLTPFRILAIVGALTAIFDGGSPGHVQRADASSSENSSSSCLSVRSDGLRYDFLDDRLLADRIGLERRFVLPERLQLPILDRTSRPDAGELAQNDKGWNVWPMVRVIQTGPKSFLMALYEEGRLGLSFARSEDGLHWVRDKRAAIAQLIPMHDGKISGPAGPMDIHDLFFNPLRGRWNALRGQRRDLLVRIRA